MSSSGWCPDHAICLEWIERRAVELVENFQEVDTVYMSVDVYEQFMNSLSSKCREPVADAGFVVSQIVISIGTLLVKPVPHFCNFCHVGTKMTYEQLEWEKISKDFEEIVLKDCERV